MATLGQAVRWFESTLGQMLEKPEHFTYDLGDKLQKKSGSKWRGKVVGFYSTDLTPEGYALESILEEGSVQIYPLKALELLK